MYALIALGYTMVYGVLEFINFAHSEIFVLGAFVGVEALLLLQSGGYLASFHPAVILLLVMVTAMVISGVAAMALERVAYRRCLAGRGWGRLFPRTGLRFFYKMPCGYLEAWCEIPFSLPIPPLD